MNGSKVLNVPDTIHTFSFMTITTEFLNMVLDWIIHRMVPKSHISKEKNPLWLRECMRNSLVLADQHVLSSFLRRYEQWFVTKPKIHAYLSLFCSISPETIRMRRRWAQGVNIRQRRGRFWGYTWLSCS